MDSAAFENAVTGPPASGAHPMEVNKTHLDEGGAGELGSGRWMASEPRPKPAAAPPTPGTPPAPPPTAHSPARVLSADPRT